MPGIVVYILFAALFLVIISLRKVPPQNALVVYRLGRPRAQHRSGVFWSLPFFDRVVAISLRPTILDLPDVSAVTSDNVPITINLKIQFTVTDSLKALSSTANFLESVGELAKKSSRECCNAYNLDETLTGLPVLGDRLERAIKTSMNNWGLRLDSARFMFIQIPKELEEAIKRRAQEEKLLRERS